MNNPQFKNISTVYCIASQHVLVKICENDAEEKLFLILVAAGMNVWVTEDMVVGIGWC